MKEKLIIKNFGPIKHVDLDLGRFNVLIGEQATGKSTVAKVLAVCRYYSFIRPEPRIVGGLSNFSEGLVKWGLREFVKKDSYIFYDCKHYSLTVEQKAIHFANGSGNKADAVEEPEYHIFDSTLKPKSEEFKDLLAAERELISSPRRGQIAMLPPSFFQNNVASVMDNPFFLPTERGLQSLFSLGQGGIQNLSNSLFNQLALLNEIANQFGGETDIEPLDIVYKNIDNKGYVRKKVDHGFYSLVNGASGFQSCVPIVLVAKYYQSIIEKIKTLIIEELELNLYPDAQYKLMQFLVSSSNYGNSIFLTTHSPYILTSLNNLMYAYQTGQHHKSAANDVIAEKYWIDPEDVSAYMLLPDGGCEDVFDREEGLLKAEKTDGVSRVINSQFDKLLNIELGIDDEKS